MPKKLSPPDVTPRNEAFSKRLQSLLLERNWNQAELARAAGLGRDSISTYIRGSVFPDTKNLKKLADAFGLTPQQVMPTEMSQLIQAEVPALEIRQSSSDPTKVFIRINRTVTVEQAAQIFSILNHA